LSGQGKVMKSEGTIYIIDWLIDWLIDWRNTTM
jgi:hypothetical protein